MSKVVVWGDLKAKTLDKPISIVLSCEAGDVKNIVKGTVKPTDKYNIEKI